MSLKVEGDIIFKQLKAIRDSNFSYVVADESTGEAVVIDPRMQPDMELSFLKQNGLKLTYIINTHDHFDHTGGNAFLAKSTGAKIAMHESARSHHDINLGDGDVLSLGNLELLVIHTPGHTPDSICILAGKELISGDTLFVGKVGGTGFGSDALNEYESLHNKLMTLPPDTRVWPGHDCGVRPSSTIGDEKSENPFILQDSFESFIKLKQNWHEYKMKHGIK